MSEYVRKQALLEWLESEMSINKGHPDDIDIHWTLNRVSKKILSGAFDADNSEVQRLRAALEMAQSELRWGDPANAIERVERIIDEALSTTTVQAERVKPFQQRLVELTIEENKRIYKDGINAPKGDGNDA